MALEIRYDADGCEGALERVEDTEVPTVETLARWVGAGFGAIGFAGVLWSVGHTYSILAALFVGLVGLTIALLEVVPHLTWRTVQNVIREPFRVRQGVLELHADGRSRTAVLAGARVKRFPTGITVVPRLGEAVDLIWDGAEGEEGDVFAAALEAAAAGSTLARGEASEVPGALRRLVE